MKQVLCISTLIAGVGLIIAGASAAQAQDGSMYITLKGAKALSLRSTFDPTGGVPTDSYDLDFKNEWAVSTSIGHRLNEYLRIEGELGYLVNTVEKLSSDTITISGTGGGSVFTSYTMASVLADLPLTDQLTAFAGGGIGVAKPGMDKQLLTGTGQTREMEIEDQYVFAWKLTGGLSYEMYENTHFFADYTYFQTADFDIKQKSVIGGTPGQNTLETNLSTHMIGVGLRYDF
ncbi:outer membrane protein [Pseudovibrio ascidiaceicola]|uniref:outer membrane protein n=1 Tax=Pseudovibrio ascidiaceicola TaxID=285279 RepID=UPI0013573997|nr:outer membrane beta-barrel protein [Pseudovibrio ascidiaceicola]